MIEKERIEEAREELKFKHPFANDETIESLIKQVVMLAELGGNENE